MTWRAELTDTFGGEANYAWVRRETFTLAHDATDRQIVAAGKSALGLSGTRCRTTNYGDLFECRPVGTCTVAFIKLLADAGYLEDLEPALQQATFSDNP